MEGTEESYIFNSILKTVSYLALVFIISIPIAAMLRHKERSGLISRLIKKNKQEIKKEGTSRARKWSSPEARKPKELTFLPPY